MIRIVIKNPESVCRGVRSITLNGERLTDNLVPADKLDDQNQVEVILG
jgi:cellobiose phosphorylase